MLDPTQNAVTTRIVHLEVDGPHSAPDPAELRALAARQPSGRLVEVQGTGESGTFDRKLLDRMLDVAEKGIGELARIQSRVLGA